MTLVYPELTEGNESYNLADKIVDTGFYFLTFAP